MEVGWCTLRVPVTLGLFNPAPTFRLPNVPTGSRRCSTRASNSTAYRLRRLPSRRMLFERWLVGLVFPARRFSHFSSGGAEANFRALLLALARACPTLPHMAHGIQQSPDILRFRKESHLAWFKIPHQANRGIGRAAVRLVEPMEPAAGHACLCRNAARVTGAVTTAQVMIVATAGTTNAGID